MSAGAMYLSARQGAADHRLAAGMAAKSGNYRQAYFSSSAAAFHDRNAAEIRTQLHASRMLGLGGSAGRVPANYFSDAPTPPASVRSVPSVVKTAGA